MWFNQNNKMLIGKIQIPTLEELFISKIEEQIFSGRLKPGDKLPTERQLQQETNISRSVIHAALVSLEKKGIIEIKNRSGAYVLDYTVTGTLEALNANIRHNGGRMTKKQAEDFFEIRMVIEGCAMRKLAESHTEDDIKKLMVIVEDAEVLANSCNCDINALSQQLFIFQRSICSYCGNEIFPLLMNEFAPIILRFWDESIANFGPNKNVSLARKFVEDIEKGDAEGAIQRLERSSVAYIDCYK